jgi:hypothetical protein
MCITSGSGLQKNTFEECFDGWKSGNECYGYFHNGNIGVMMWSLIQVQPKDE